MEVMAKYLVSGDVISLNKHPYEINTITKGINVYHADVSSMRGKKKREVSFSPSEFIKVKEQSPLIPKSELFE